MAIKQLRQLLIFTVFLGLAVVVFTLESRSTLAHSTAISYQIKPEVGLTQAAGQLPLAEDGPYHAAVKVVTLTDKARDDAKLAISIWYPSVQAAATPETVDSGLAMLKEAATLKANPTLKAPSLVNLDAGTLVNVVEVNGRWTHIESADGTSGWVLSENVMSRASIPDASGAPYPLLLYSHGLMGSRWEDPGVFLHLASHGFVVASIDHTCDSQPTCLIDRPLDILFVLDQLAGLSTGDLAGMIASDNAGVLGVSYGGYTALATTGARIDPDYFLNWYAQRT